MKILWFCNQLFTEEKITGTGAWLVAMSNALIKTGEVELYNITTGDVKRIQKVDYNGIQQWLIPRSRRSKNGLPSNRIIKEIQRIANEVNPDIIHIWGTENTWWGLLTARGLIKGNVLLEMQGLISQIRKYIFSGLSFIEILKCIGIKEILKPWGSIFTLKKMYNKNSNFEIEMLRKHNIISVPSNWIRAHVNRYNSSAKVYNTKILLREEFINCNKWEHNNCHKFKIFTILSAPLPYKGLHVLIDAISLLKKDYPKIKLIIAGNIGSGIRINGYIRLLKRKIKHNNIEKNVQWAGPLNASDIINQLMSANVAVSPSFIESYSNVLEEMLSVGVPTVASYSGAMPERGKDGESALFFPPGDEFLCAEMIEKIFIDDKLANNLSTNAFLSKSRTGVKDISKLQIDIYKDILKNNKH